MLNFVMICVGVEILAVKDNKTERAEHHRDMILLNK